MSVHQEHRFTHSLTLLLTKALQHSTYRTETTTVCTRGSLSSISTAATEQHFQTYTLADCPIHPKQPNRLQDCAPHCGKSHSQDRCASSTPPGPPPLSLHSPSPFPPHRGATDPYIFSTSMAAYFSSILHWGPHPRPCWTPATHPSRATSCAAALTCLSTPASSTHQSHHSKTILFFFVVRVLQKTLPDS